MKKFIFIALVLFVSSVSFSQDKEIQAANKKTAERCLKIAQSYIAKSEWSKAYSQSVMGLSYDSTISDLIYIKAVSLSKMNKKKSEVLDAIAPAFFYNNWISSDKNNARILYADYLCETGDYEKSLDILNQEPLLYSADAEFIRIKNNYRICTQDSLELARNELLNCRKIYPLDERFAKIFFMFEFTYITYAQKTNQSYYISEAIQKAANEYIAKFPNYKTKDTSMELMASVFATGETKKRLILAVGEKNNNSSLYAYVALKEGLISQEKAYNLFFDSANNNFDLQLLENFSSLITDEELKKNLVKQLNSFTGTLYIDQDLDLRNELVVKYNRGRAEYIYYDENTDDDLEIYAACDYGVPLSISFASSSLDLFYDIYPAVSKIIINNKNATFNFLHNDFVYSPFMMNVEPYFASLGVNFIIPYIKKNLDIPPYTQIFKSAAGLDVKNYERSSSYVKYTFLKGKAKMAYFYEGNKYYAYGDVSHGFPFVRYVDYDNDNIYETTEYFDVDTKNEYTNKEDKQVIKNIFGDFPFAENLYLRKVEIDRDNDTNKEFKEEYLPFGASIVSWDEDDNGIWDSEFIRYAPNEKDGSVKEETIFYNSNGTVYIILTDINKEPVGIQVEGKDYKIEKGTQKNVYWLYSKESDVIEFELLKKLPKNLNSGAVQIVVLNDERYTIIKIGNNYFFKKIPVAE